MDCNPLARTYKFRTNPTYLKITIGFCWLLKTMLLWPIRCTHPQYVFLQYLLCTCCRTLVVYNLYILCRLNTGYLVFCKSWNTFPYILQILDPQLLVSPVLLLFSFSVLPVLRLDLFRWPASVGS